MNLDHLQNIGRVADIGLDEDILADIFDHELKPHWEDTVRNLTPICQLINKCQDPLVNIADAIEEWMSLDVPTNDYDDHILRRIYDATSPVGYAANILHQKYQGLSLNEAQKSVGERFITKNLNDCGKQELAFYRNNAARFQALVDKCTCPVTFWTLIKSTLPNLSEFALKLLVIPASTALIEGLFSNWTYVHSIARNRLGNVRSGQLIEIYHSLKYLDLDNQWEPRKRKKPGKKHLRLQSIE